MQGQWMQACDPRSTSGFTGTVGQWFAMLGARNGWADPYDQWIRAGGQPNCSDKGQGAHPQDYINCDAVTADTAAVGPSLYDRLEGRTFNIPNYVLAGAGALGLGGLLAAKGKLGKKRRRRR